MRANGFYGVRIPGCPINRDEEMQAWADSVGIRFWFGAYAMNPETWKWEQTYFFNNEQDKLIFLLRWSNTR